jgi:hypothetical protein
MDAELAEEDAEGELLELERLKQMQEILPTPEQIRKEERQNRMIEQSLGHWLVQIEADESRRMETPTER